ncbi:MAG: helix-turn-helix domain-containing protein [Micromonosporaceae bacterium]
MRKGVGKTIQARQLGRHLRELRKEAGVGVDAAVREIGVSDATLYRFEAGTSVPRPPDVKALCAMYGTDADLIDGLVGLAKEANSPGWWRSYMGVIPRGVDTYVSLEGAAEHIRSYEMDVVHGLLQTPRYAEALFRTAIPVPSEDEVRRRIDVRMRRQRILDRRTAPRLDVVVGEVALLRSPGDDIMAEQLAHLDALSRRPDLTIRVLPMNLLHGGLVCGARFHMMTFPTDRRGLGEPPVVHAENLTGGVFLSEPEEIDAYELIWNAVLEVALSPPESRALINDYRERYER